MSGGRILVTGGSGFIGSGLVKALLLAGNQVRVIDNNSRGNLRRLKGVTRDIEFVYADIRDADAVTRAAKDVDEVHHLAFVNGTEFFYKAPDLVLDVGVRGMINVIEACRKHDIGKLVLASSSEVYQTPPKIPSDERVPLTVPDPLNPRYSYGAGKLISEVLAINFGRKFFDRVLIFRPHNIYGPDMGCEHVIPQFALRLRALAKAQASGRIRFEIQGTGEETRSFCFIDDLIAGIMVMRDRGEHLGSITSAPWRKWRSPTWRLVLRARPDAKSRRSPVCQHRAEWPDGAPIFRSWPGWAITPACRSTTA